MRARWWGLALLGAVGILALASGLAVAFHERTRSFGWFAYAPLSDDVAVPWVLTGREAVGWALCVAGAVLVAGCLGYAVGVRHGARSRRPNDRPTS